jgi:N-acetylglucosaminyldiphosphoundecaprenol N-acetyl-beta-D-mannosaminyltransferase
VTTDAYFPRIASNATGMPVAVPTVSIDGIPIFDGTAEEATDACLRLLATGGRVATANLDFLALARKNSALRRNLQASDLVIADGMPVVWLAKLSGAQRVKRLAGVDLVGALFEAERRTPLRIAMYGSTELIASAAVPALEALGSGGKVVHVSNPPFRRLTAGEVEADLTALAAAEPEVVLVALGCPAQEQLIAGWAPRLPGAVWIGIGGTLDFYAGVRHRAPRLAQSFGVEWVVRMAQEPRRLGRRYLLRDVPALFAIAPGCLRTRFSRASGVSV